MPEILDDYTPFGRGPGPKYPWDEWFDGQKRRITKGVDFEATLTSMEHLIRKTAKHRSIRIHAHIERDLDSIVFWAIIDEQVTS